LLIGFVEIRGFLSLVVVRAKDFLIFGEVLTSDGIQFVFGDEEGGADFIIIEIEIKTVSPLFIF
jgi:hypothetical protein